MSIALTRTKIRVPRRRANILSRPRLNAILTDLLDYPFTLISAPAGYGKTSLMIDLAHQASHPVCWYSLDPLDKDPKRFLAHFIHAIKMEFPEFGQPSLGLLDNLADPLGSPDQFISTITNDIYNSISENFVIFLDDFHLLDDQPEINGFISSLGQQMDENAHLVISSRKLFNFPDLPLLVSHMQVKGVDQEDLAFQPRELQEYFQEKRHLTITEKDALELISNTAGWIAGLILIEGKESGLLSEKNKATRVTGIDLGSYFAEEIFLNQSKTVRKLLLQTSLFDEFNTTFCESVLGESDQVSWSDFFEILVDHNLFIDQIEDNGIWIRYHHLFRDFLRETLARQHPGEMSQILNRLVEFNVEQQNWEKAFEATRQLEDPLQMAQVIKQAFSPLFHAGRIKLLADWLEILPDEGYSAIPSLYSLKGFTYTELGNPNLGLSEITKAIENEHIISDPELLAKSLIWSSTANRILGNYDEGIASSFAAISILENESILHIIEAEACREIGLGFGRKGNNNEALEFLKKASNKYENEDKTNNLAQVQTDIGLILMSMGNIQEAEIFFERTISHWAARGNNIQLSMIMNNLGFLSILTGNYYDANIYLDKGEKHAELVSSRRMQAFITASRGDLTQAINLYNRSIRYYDKALIVSKEIHDSFLSIYIQIAKATCLRCLQKYSQAEEILKELEEGICQGASQYELGLWHLEWGFLHLAQGAIKPALDAFQIAHDIFSGIRRPFEQTKSALGLCLTSKYEQDKESLNKHLADLGEILAGLETKQPLLPEFNRQLENIKQLLTYMPDQDQLELCLEEISRYQGRLLAIQESIYPKPTAVSVSPGLEIQGFGNISVILSGKRITAPEWIHQKTVRELLFYLMAHPQGVTKAQVGLAFWPESAPSQLSCQFKNAMYRLRRSIGTESILYHQETRSYSFNWKGCYTYDVEEFQRAIKQASFHTNEDLRLEYLRKAVSIYKHPFASQLDGIWAEPVRRKLYLDYEKALLEIAEHELGTENYVACRDACLAILEIEPCQEKAYQICMRAYSCLDNLTEIHRLFNRCVQNFNESLGIRPSNITINLFKQLSSK